MRAKKVTVGVHVLPVGVVSNDFVALPTTPVAEILLAFWNALTAFSVTAPKVPVTSPM